SRTQLKRRANRGQRNVELQVFAREIIGQLRTDCFKVLVFSGDYICSQSFSQERQFTFGPAAVDKLEQPQAFVIRNRYHRSERRIDSLRPKRCTSFWIRRGFAKNPGERFAKSALRFKPAAVSRFGPPAALPHLAQGETHPARAMISLKRHSVVAFELTSRGRGIDRQRGQFFVCKPSAGRALHFSA